MSNTLPSTQNSATKRKAAPYVQNSGKKRKFEGPVRNPLSLLPYQSLQSRSNIQKHAYVRRKVVAKTDKENVPYHEQYQSVTPIDDRETDCKRDLLCEEVLKGEDPEPTLEDELPSQQPTVQPLPKNSNLFDCLPDEILMIIFQRLPYTYKELRNLKCVCRKWNELLADSSLKYGLFNEDLEVMMKNEKKHHSQLRDYLQAYGTREINADMRGILVDWLIEVGEEYRLDGETVFLCIHYVDRYLSKLREPLTRGKLQLLGVTALLVASKYEEIYVPTVNDMIYITDNTYTREEILGMEINLLNALKFDITVYTVRRFVHYFLSLAENCIPNCRKSTLKYTANYLAELSMLEYKLMLQPISLVAASVVCLSLHTLGYGWTKKLEHETHYSVESMMKCIEAIHTLQVNAPKLTLQAVVTKYSQPKFESVALQNVPFSLDIKVIQETKQAV